LIENQLVTLAAGLVTRHALVDAAGVGVVPDHRIVEGWIARIPTIVRAIVFGRLEQAGAEQHVA
jgi:hypothetical protein